MSTMRSHGDHLAHRDLHVRGLALGAAVGLVDEDAGVGQGRAVAFGAGGQQDGGGRAGLAHADRVDRRAHELHGVVHREQGGHVAAGRVDVEVHRAVHVLALEVEQLGDDQVGDALVG
jgi:hypothetical protein